MIFLAELYHLAGCLLKSHAEGVLGDIFQKNELQVNRAVIDEIISSLCSANPLKKAIERDGPLGSAYQRKQYYKAKCNVVEPFEYVLDSKEKKTFQYVPILQSLKVLLHFQENFCCQGKFVVRGRLKCIHNTIC